MALDNFRRIDMQINRANDYQLETQFAKEGDYNGRELVVQITNAGEISDQTGVSLNLGWHHNSVGNAGLDPFTVVDDSKGIFKITYPTEMLNAGDVTATIQVIENGKITLTRNFKITVENNPIDEDAIVSENSFTVLQEALVKVTDLEENYAPRLNEVTTQLAHTESKVKNIVTPFMFGAVGDQVNDDTVPFQQAIDYAIANNLTFDWSGSYAVNSIDINEEMDIVGICHLIPVVENQEYVMNIAKKSTIAGELIVNGKYMALNGIRISSYIEGFINKVEVNNCKVWAFTFDTVGNNTMTHINQIKAIQNGSKHSTTYSQLSFTGSGIGPNDFSTVSLETPIPDLLTKPYDVLYVFINERPYLVKSVIDNSTLEIYHLNSESGSIEVLIGGGVNVPAYPSNGACNWGTVDLRVNTVALNMSAMYSHGIAKFVAQGNDVAWGTSDFTMGLTLSNAYFEVNDVDIVVFNYIRGTIISPVGLDEDKMYRLVFNYVYNTNDFTSNLTIIRDNKIRSEVFKDNYMQLGNYSIINPVVITSALTKSKIEIPIRQQSATHYSFLLDFYFSNGANNAASPKGYRCTVQFSSISSIKEAKILEASDSDISLSVDGMNLVFNLPEGYESLSIGCVGVTRAPHLINLNDARLV